MSNVPPVQFTPAGLVVPTESAVLAGVQADFQDAFGGELNEALETPQGQLASSEAAIISDANAQLAELVNQVNPDTASGFMQDAIARIYFLNRSPGAPTAVQCVCTGSFGTIIPVGAQAQDTSGNRYVCTQAGTIPVGGSVTLSFANVVNGPIACPANTLNRIFQAIPGWDTINNPADGVVGADVETRAAFELRRAQSVALNARGSLPSINAAVFDVPDVLDVFVFENVTNDPITVGSTNYPMVPHSLLVSVVGGEAQAIAEAIWTKKDVGCDYNGNTEVTVTDSGSGYLPPLPSYTVKFERPAPLAIKFAVEIQDSDALPNNIEDLVKGAIVGTFNGVDGGQRVRIGSNLLASKFYPGIIRIGPEVSLLSVLLGSVTPTLTSQLIGVDQAPTVNPDDISVTLVP
jgi:hypothetical protein